MQKREEKVGEAADGITGRAALDSLSSMDICELGLQWTYQSEWRGPEEDNYEGMDSHLCGPSQ